MERIDIVVSILFNLLQPILEQNFYGEYESAYLLNIISYLGYNSLFIFKYLYISKIPLKFISNYSILIYYYIYINNI